MLSGGKGTIFGRWFYSPKNSSVEFHFGGETAWLGAPDVALRCVWTVSNSSELECILADFLFPPRECILANFNQSNVEAKKSTEQIIMYLVQFSPTLYC